jgi:hypothetical protein
MSTIPNNRRHQNNQRNRQLLKQKNGRLIKVTKNLNQAQKTKSKTSSSKQSKKKNQKPKNN